MSYGPSKFNSDAEYFRYSALFIKKKGQGLDPGEEAELQKLEQIAQRRQLEQSPASSAPTNVTPGHNPQGVNAGAKPTAQTSQELPEAFKPKRVVTPSAPSQDVLNTIAANQAKKASIPTDFKPSGNALPLSSLGVPANTPRPSGGKMPRVGARDQVEFEKLQASLGQDYQILPSSEIRNGVRRVAIRRISDNEVLALDLGMQRNVNPLGLVFTEGRPDAENQEGAAIIGPYTFGRFNKDKAPGAQVGFQGYTGHQNLQMRIASAFWAKDTGIVETAQQGWSYALSGHFDMPAVTRIPGNAPEQVRQEAMRKVPFMMGAANPKDKLAPYQSEAIEAEYRNRVGSFIGKISNLPGEETTWTALRSRFYSFEKGGANLVPYADIVHTEYAGVPGQQSVLRAEGQVSATALKAKRSVGYGGTEVYPYVRQTTESGAEIFVRQQPAELTPENQAQPYAYMTARYPGTQSRMPAENRNMLFTTVPGIPGSHLLMENPSANRPDAYGNEGVLRETLPDANILQLLSGEQKLNFPSQEGQYYPLGERPINVGTYTRGGKEFPVEMQKGTAPIAPSKQWLDVPAFINPQTGEGVASEEFGVSTKSYIAKLQEATGIQDIRRTTVNKISLGMSGFAQYVGGNRFFDVKSLPSPTGESMRVDYGGTSMDIDEVGGEVKGAQIAFAFMGRRNVEQLRGIFGDWAANVGTEQSRQLNEYVQRQFLSPAEGQAPEVDYERVASKYRELTRGLPQDQRFRGSGFGFLQEIFNRQFVDLDLNTPEGQLQNVRNWKLYQGGYVGSQNVSMPVDPEQYEMLRGHAIRAIQRTSPDMDEEAAGKLFEQYFQLGGTTPDSIVANALRSVNQGTAMQMTFPSAERTFAASVAMPMTAKMIGEGQVNMEAQLAMSQNYPEFARELGVAVHQQGRISPTQSAALSLAGFAAFTKSAMEGSPVEPTSADTLTEDQMLKLQDALNNKDMTNKEFLSRVQEVAGGGDRYLRFPKTQAVLPGAAHIGELTHERYEEEVGPLAGRYRKAVEKLLGEELAIGAPPNYDPVEAGTRAVSGLFHHAENLFKGKGEVAKHIFSKEPQFALTTGFAGSLALRGHEIYLPSEIQKHMLAGGGLRGRALLENLSIFEGENGIPALSLRHPQMGMKLLPSSLGGGGMLRRAYGAARAQRIESNPRMWGVSLTGQALAQKDIGDFDWDMLTTVAGLKIQTGEETYLDRQGNEKVRRKREVVPLSPEKLQEINQMTMEELNAEEARSFANKEQRDRSNAIVGSFEDYFNKIGKGGGVTQKDIIRSALSQEKYGWKTWEEVGRRSLEIKRATTIGMGGPYGVWRQQLVGAALTGTDLNQLGSPQADYTLGLDMWKLGQEAAGARLPAALSKMYAGMKVIEGEGGAPIGEEAYIGYSTNVKDEFDIPEYNRLYAKDVGSGGVSDFLNRLVSHATAPIQETGKEPMYIRSAEQMAALFAREEDRETLQRRLEGMAPQDYGYAISKYHRGLYDQKEGPQAYEHRLMATIPILLGAGARVVSKSAQGGDRGVAARAAVEQFGEVLGPELMNTWRVGSGLHDILYRFPQGMPSASRLTGMPTGIRNEKLAGLAKRVTSQLGIPIDANFPGLPVSALPSVTGASQVAPQVANEAQPDALPPEEQAELDQLSTKGGLTSDNIKRFNELRQKKYGITPQGKEQENGEADQVAAQIAARFNTIAQEPTPEEYSQRMAESGFTGSSGGSFGNIGGGGGGGFSGGGGGGGGGSNNNNPPFSGRQANIAVKRAFINMQRFQSRIPQAMEDLGRFMGMGADDPEPLFKAFAQRLGADPVGTLAQMSPRLSKFVHRMGTVSDIRARGLAALSRSDYATDPDINRLLKDPMLGHSLNELGAIGKSFTSAEMGMNPWLMGQAQSLPTATGFDELYQGVQKQGLLDQWAFTPGEFTQRAGALLSGPDAARNRQLINQSLRLKTKFSGDKAEMLDPRVQALGNLGEAIKTMEPNLLKESQAKGGITINIPVEKIEKLNQLYEKQAALSEQLAKSGEQRSKSDEKRLQLEKAQVDLDIRKEQGSIYKIGLQQEVQGYREMLKSGEAPAGTVKKLRSAEKELLGLQAEEQQQIADEGVGPWGRTARRLLGGFGFMYARSVFNFATGGLGFGQQERAGLESTIAQGMYGSLGIARTPYNQTLALQNQVALSGQSTNPITGLSQLAAQNPGLRDMWNMGVAGIGAWGFTQYAASTMPAGDPWGQRLTRASPYVGLAAGGLALAAEMNARSQDPTGIAWRMTAGGIPSPLDYATTGFMAMFNRGGAQEVGRMAGIFRATDRAFEQGGNVNDLMQTRGQNAVGRWLPGRGLLAALTGRDFGGVEQGGLLGDRGDYNQAIVRELIQRNPSLSDQAAAQTAGWLQTYAPGLAINDNRVSQVAADYQMGGRAGVFAEQMLLMGGTPMGRMYNAQGGVAPIAQLQMQLAGMGLDQGQQALIQSGLQRGGQVAGIAALAPGERANPLQRVDYWSRLGGMSESQFGLYRAQAEAADLARQANLPGVALPSLGGVEGITDKYQLSTMTAQAQGDIFRAQNRMQMAQGQLQQSYQFGNLQLGNALYNKMTNVPAGQEWLYNDLYSMDPRTMAFMGTQGLNFNNMPGIGLFGGGRISGASYNQMDVGLNGQLTGLGYGRTSFAQAGGFGASQMMGNLFGQNWRNNAMFSQGALNAGLNGMNLLAPIRLPDGTTVSSVGGSMGMELYQDQLQYQHQMAEIGRQQRGNQLQFAFTTGVGLSAYNGTVDPRTGRPFGNLGATGGFWGLEDRSRQMGYAQQEWQFGFQQRQIDLGNRQFRENQGMQIYQSQLQRGWTREDWGYQDMTRDMQWGWKQEDFQEEARFMTGRQRRLAERQMKRDTTMHNLEGDQIDKQRGRQEELWKLEDERFKIQRKQHTENVAMQEESLKKQREFFEERKKLEEQQTKLQRAYFIQQNALQREATEAAAGYAKENLRLRQTFAQLQIATELSRGQLNLITKDGFEQLREAMLAADPAIKKIIDRFFELAGMSGIGSGNIPGGYVPNGSGFFVGTPPPVTTTSSTGGTTGGHTTTTSPTGTTGSHSTSTFDDYMQGVVTRIRERDKVASDKPSLSSSFMPMPTGGQASGRSQTINVYVGNELLRTFVVDSVNQDLHL